MSDIRLSEKIGSAFYDVAHDVFHHGHTHYDFSGGRGSLKSSTVSVLVPLLLINNPNTHALVLRKVANTIRDSVYAQYIWAIGELGMAAHIRQDQGDQQQDVHRAVHVVEISPADEADEDCQSDEDQDRIILADFRLFLLVVGFVLLVELLLQFLILICHGDSLPL